MDISEKTFTIISTTIVLLFLVTAIIIMLLVASRKMIKQQITLSQTRLHYEQELRTVEQEVQEAVMNHISQELHDNIGQLLTLMRVQVEQGKKKHPDAAIILAPVNETIATAIKQVRSLSNTLNSDYIERNGLRETIAQEVIRLQQLDHIRVHFDGDGTEPHLSKDQCLMAFRIFQEMLNNTLKHAQPQNIYILLTGSRQFKLQVRDDGNGFDVAHIMQQAGGNGLKNMQKRATLAGLAFEVTSAPGAGCTYAIQDVTTAAVG
jgi:signal transduction histidine kinase